MKRFVTGVLSLAALCALAGRSRAGIVLTALGTAAPPATLDGYTMTPFGAAPSPLFSNVSSVAAPLGGSLDFSIPLNHRKIGSGWATWSNGYTGDVYFTNGATSVNLTMNPDVGAFYFYAEPDPFATYNITAVASDPPPLPHPPSAPAA